MRRSRYLLLLLAIYFAFIGGSSRYVTVYQIRVFHHIIVTLVLGLWLIFRIRRNKGLPTTALNIPLFAVMGVWFISAITSIDPRMAFEHIWFPVTHIILFFVVVDYFQRGRGKIIMEIFFFTVMIVIFLTGLELASWYFGLGLLPGTEVGWNDVSILIPPYLPKVSMALGISTLVAGFTTPALFVTATWAYTARHKVHRRILWVITFLLLITLILTFSRGGLLAFLGGLAVFIIIRAIQHPALTSRLSSKWIGGIGGSIAMAALIGFVAITLPFGIGVSDKGRVDMWQSAVKITLDHPLTGVGPGLFGRAHRDYRDPLVSRDKLASAHNAYLNLSSETGLLGILVGAWLGYTLIKASWQTWKQAKGRNQHLRVEGLFAALSVLAVHSTIDVFTITPINLVIIVIVAYLVTGHRSILDPLPDGQTKPAYALIAIVLLYGGILINWDRAQGLFQASFGQPYAEALELTQEAQTIDPYLNLYRLHEAFLLGNRANDPESIDNAINAYETILELEPTWTIGWINLAALELERGNELQPLEYLAIANDINPISSASFAYARLAEEMSVPIEATIILAYRHAITANQNALLSSAWWDTPLATKASLALLSSQPVDWRYRIFQHFQPELAKELIPQNPQTDIEWWVVGEHALNNNELQQAETAFTNAIELNPINGDYYVSRAKARLDQPELAQRDLDLAQVYGTRFEYPKAIMAQFAATVEEANQLRATALPLRIQSQEFAAVMFARPAIFDIPREMRLPGLGTTELEPWYVVAESFESEGDIEAAIRAYDFILDHAPYEIRAAEKLSELTAEVDS